VSQAAVSTCTKYEASILNKCVILNSLNDRQNLYVFTFSKISCYA